MRAKVILLGIESNGIINQTKLDIAKAFILYIFCYLPFYFQPIIGGYFDA